MENVAKTDLMLLKFCWALAFAGIVFGCVLVKMFW
ncbi:hypothetical protein EZJ58_1752 [Sodalis ligni]|jgi:hypothetical protein|uniref:Uncharacterized protein n=1 Tax=Sodalis ligni TaxID=2697027 RepID=A0A4R1N8L2_9GAMM|nr:hypothetical protein EZJ58_1752 [Sodalis ligni]